MWVSSPTSLPLLLRLRRRQPPQSPPHILPIPRLPSAPPRNLAVAVAAGENTRGLGKTLITALNQTHESKNQNQDEEEEEEEKKMSGSDVLWALQRAAATKQSKKKTKKRVVSSAVSRREEDDVDYSDVKPLVVNREWSVRLDDLEKQLLQLSDMV